MGTPATLAPVNLDNVQGDILEGLAKKFESFFFFRIGDDVAAFRRQLGRFLPYITSVNEAIDWQNQIADAKNAAAIEGRAPNILPLLGFNIAFSQTGLTALGITDDLNDPVFTAGMRAGAPTLADNLDLWDPDFKQDIHGVILLAASSPVLVESAFATFETIFKLGQPNAGIIKMKELHGHLRPGKESGHEHFGFNDGLSQPAVKDITTDIQPGQETISQGVILLGRELDNGTAPPGGSGPGPVVRPPWAVDASFLTFRYLRQLVPEFNAFLKANALPVPTNPPPPAGSNGADLLGARLVGRWKSGAPVDATPLADNPSLAAPDKNQVFRYDPLSQDRCPFAAHTRKTNPRADLEALGGTEVRRILRRGIPFGPEVTYEERECHRSSDAEELERGLLFACYQSNLSNGFQFIQQSWVNQPFFPPFKTAAPVNPPVPNPPGPGVDPIIGQAPTREMVGTNPVSALTELQLPVSNQTWVISRGGEYFISPTLSALTTVFAGLPGESPQDEL